MKPGAATAPTTTTAGDRTATSWATRAAVASVAWVTRSRSVDPFSMIATGRSASTPAPIAARADLRQRPHGHEQHEGRPGRQGGDGRRLGAGVTRRDVHRRRDPALGQRDAGQDRHGDRRADARHHRDLHTGRTTGMQLLAAAPVDERVPALEPHDDLSLLRPLDEEPVDLRLRHRVAARGLPDVDDLDVRWKTLEQPRRAQPVGHHDVGTGEGLRRGERDQAGVPGSTADEHHPPAVLTASAQVHLPRREVAGERVAHPSRPPRVGVGVGDHPDDQVVVPARRDAARRPGRAVDAPRASGPRTTGARPRRPGRSRWRRRPARRRPRRTPPRLARRARRDHRAARPRAHAPHPRAPGRRAPRERRPRPAGGPAASPPHPHRPRRPAAPRGRARAGSSRRGQSPRPR